MKLRPSLGTAATSTCLAFPLVHDAVAPDIGSSFRRSFAFAVAKPLLFPTSRSENNETSFLFLLFRPHSLRPRTREREREAQQKILISPAEFSRFHLLEKVVLCALVEYFLWRLITHPAATAHSSASQVSFTSVQLHQIQRRRTNRLGPDSASIHFHSSLNTFRLHF